MLDEEKAEEYANACRGKIKDIHWQDVKYAVLYGLVEGRKELEKEHNLLTDIIETFTSQSFTDDIEMANTAREIAEILKIKNYR